jgi:hypothetical protein
MRASHGRHTGELHAVLDDVMDVAIAEALCRSGAQVWDAGILVGSNGRSSPAIDTVTDCTAGKKRLLPLRDGIRISGDGVGPPMFRSRYRKITY